jgi:hypothetical protein
MTASLRWTERQSSIPARRDSPGCGLAPLLGQRIRHRPQHAAPDVASTWQRWRPPARQRAPAGSTLALGPPGTVHAVSGEAGSGTYVPAMHRAVTACAGWQVESWEQASGHAGSQDAKLVWPDPTVGLRVAVLDGVTPSLRCRTVVGVDGAMYAAAIVRLALQRTGGALDECVLAANRHLHDPTLARSRDQMQACVTAADLSPDGHVEVVRAGDCEAWARTEQGWVSFGAGTALTADVEAEWAEWQRRHTTVSRDVRHDAEERFLGRPEAWTSTAVGRFVPPRLRRFSADGVQELVLASDGARLSEPVLDDLPAWLGELREWEHQRSDLGRAAEKVHDDVTVLRLRPAAVEDVAAMSRSGRALRRDAAHPRSATLERRAG